ncbi:MAG TPA: patatin-like phospholipase family protein [Hyphomicrobiaceae bacterium]|nr:patatin-like phospholipase family protein [Hyphomicrobiaceae bacterium]
MKRRRVRWRLAALLASLLIALVGGARLYYGPIRTLEPVGRCITAGIDLNNPVPFAQPRFSGSVLGIASSGGGSRAAYLSAAVLREVRRAGPALMLGGLPDSNRSLLDQIDVMSSVSGGSLAASYFALNHEPLRQAAADSALWTDYLDKMAVNYRTRQWYGQAASNPLVWAKALFTDYNRGVLAREDYDALLFKGVSLDRLPDRPALYINAFDVANHVRFVLSKHYIDTTYSQPRGWWGKLGAPQTLLSENDLGFTRTDPASIRLADAVYASSSFPIAYPNLPLRHCGSKILFQGGLIFLADGSLADNSGLITLLTQIRANLDQKARGSSVVAISIDASVDRIDTNGTKFQQMGIEEGYASHNTVFGHALESIYGAIALLQDLGWKLIESTDVVTDQLNMNWPIDLTRRTGRCGPASKTSWGNLFETGVLAMRPLVIRLGLRDVIDADFASRYGAGLADSAALAALLQANKIPDGIASLSKHISRRLQSIPTDFTLSQSDRTLLDLVAFLLVHGKLAGDVAQWNEGWRTLPSGQNPPISCQP